MPDFSEPPWSTIVDLAQEYVLPIALIVAIAYVLLRASKVFAHGIFRALIDREATEGTAQELSAVELKKRMDTLDGLATKVVNFLIIVIAGLMILGSLGLDIGPAVAGLGVVGVAVGFGAQHLVRDYLNGALIMIENQYSKGDVVRVAGLAGVVEDFSLRRTTLRDLDGNVHTVPNGEITTSTNMTRVWARVNEDVQVGYGTNIDLAADVIGRVGKEMRADKAWRRKILEPPKLERVQELADSGVTLKILATVRAPDRWAVAGELRRRLLVAFAAEGIEIPFPHRVVVTRPASSDADGSTDGPRRRRRAPTPDADSGISQEAAEATGNPSQDVSLD